MRHFRAADQQAGQQQAGQLHSKPGQLQQQQGLSTSELLTHEAVSQHVSGERQLLENELRVD